MKLSAHKSNVHEQYTYHELEYLRGELQKSSGFQQDIIEHR